MKIVICDHLSMLVTGDPVVELDHALAIASERLQQARDEKDAFVVRCLTRWIDGLLDQRSSLAPEAQEESRTSWSAASR